MLFTMSETEEFNALTFEKKLMNLKDTQDNIQSLSSWCLKQRIHHKRIVQSWLSVLKRVKVEQRLVLFYLANDVIQYSKRKNYEFVESWGLNLQKATPLVRDEKIRHKILRIFKIWEQRSVYDEEFLSDLTGLLQAGAMKKTDDDSLEFQPQQLVNKIKQCSVLEADTDLRLKYIHESHLQLSDSEELRNSLKDRTNKDDVEKELNEGIGCVERYTQALQREIVAREALLALLTAATQYYSTQRGEVKVVAYAYKNFGARVRTLKRKLDELIPNLPNAAPSPPQRDEDVPSPGPDEDLDLPAPDNGDENVTYNIDKTFNTSLSADGSLYNLGLSSFLSSDNPLAIFNDSNMNTNKIQVISNRSEETAENVSVHEIVKNLITNECNTPEHSVTSNTSQKSQDALPGLDLLTPESTGNPPPPISFYGSMENSINDEPEQSYQPEINQWNNESWSVPYSGVEGTAPAGGATVFAEAPASPPHVPRLLPPPEPAVYPQENHAADVDHRGILPPPPPPPVLPMLGGLEDIDHRHLPMPVMPPLSSTPVRHPVVQQDVDHRNLIPLTQQLPSPRPIINTMVVDQDYRVPLMVPPPDIVESVDMDLSEDEDQPGVYNNQHNIDRRTSFNNNKVLVGGDNGKTNHNDHNNSNLIRINSNEYENKSANIPNVPLLLREPPPPIRDLVLPLEQILPHDPNLPREPMMPRESITPSEPLTPREQTSSHEPLLPLPHNPLVRPLGNPFDKMPPNRKNFDTQFSDDPEDNDHLNFNEDFSRRDDGNPAERNPSPQEFMELPGECDWQQPPRPFLNQRYPRNWAPRTFRPPGFGPGQFWPRNMPPRPRWAGPRPQRFW